MILIHDPVCLEYGQPGHPESPERVRTAVQYLRRQGVYSLQTPSPAPDDAILQAHTPTHLERLRTLDFIDPDSPRHTDILRYARLSAGAALQAAQDGGFSLMRPPGHHAGPERVAGFCYLNNIAIAVRSLEGPTLILDIDGHHGDGTQAIVQDDPDVTFISLHSSPNYPGSGLASWGNCRNHPLTLNCGASIYLDTLDRALDEVDPSEYRRVAISAGFDADERDPLAPLGLGPTSYRAIGERIAALGLPAFAVLEGGYDPERLGPDIHAFYQGLASPAGWD